MDRFDVENVICIVINFIEHVNFNVHIDDFQNLGMVFIH